MKLKTLICGLLLIAGLMANSFAQDRIGYLNMELVLSYMPEAKTMAQSLQTYEQQLAKQLKIKQDYGQSKVNDYLQRRESGASESELKALEEEIRKLEQEIQKFAAEAEQKLMAKRQELLAPIMEKMKKAIDEIAERDGYDYILNSVDGSSVSVVLHGPETKDLTKSVLTELGIDIEVSENDGKPAGN